MDKQVVNKLIQVETIEFELVCKERGIVILVTIHVISLNRFRVYRCSVYSTVTAQIIISDNTSDVCGVNDTFIVAM